jgi:hypothetical protein
VEAANGAQNGTTSAQFAMHRHLLGARYRTIDDSGDDAVAGRTEAEDEVITILVAAGIAWVALLGLVLGMLHVATSSPSPRVARRRAPVASASGQLDQRLVRPERTVPSVSETKQAA